MSFYTSLSTREVCSRKARSCNFCCLQIPVGEKHLYHVGKFEGEFQEVREHLECREFANCEAEGDPDYWDESYDNPHEFRARLKEWRKAKGPA